MAGFFGLFGGKTKYVDETDTDNTATTPASDQKEDFFLSSDDSKTLGDIDYMRQSKTVRRTFAKSISGGGGELIQEVSALGSKKVNNQASQSAPAPTSSSAPATVSKSTSKTSEEVKKRRSSDSSMDMFRNMAKDLRK